MQAFCSQMWLTLCDSPTFTYDLIYFKLRLGKLVINLFELINCVSNHLKPMQKMYLKNTFTFSNTHFSFIENDSKNINFIIFIFIGGDIIQWLLQFGKNRK